MATNNIKNFLSSEDGKRNAARFIKAAKEGRIVVTVKHVSTSGMTREISVNEVVTLSNGNFAMYQFNWFLHEMGWAWGRTYTDAVKVGGCGMDMRFHLIYSTLGTLDYYGFGGDGEKLTEYASNYMVI